MFPYIGIVILQGSRRYDMLELKIVGVVNNYYAWERAVRLANSFVQDYPDRMGIRDGVGYHNPVFDDKPLYVYRTKTQIVVRGE